MRDFCNSTDRDCIRLIVAQDLKESGIDVDASNLANFSAIQNTTQSNSNQSYNLLGSSKHANMSSNNSNTSHHHHHHSSSNSNSNHTHNSSHTHSSKASQMLNTSGVHNTTSGGGGGTGNSNFFHHNSSNHNFNIFQANSSSATANSSSKNTETTLSSQHDSQLVGTKVFGVGLKQIEMVNLVINDQTLTVPW